VYLYDYYPNARLRRNWRNIDRWLEAHSIATVLRTVSKDTPRSRKKIGVSFGIVATRVLISAMLDFDGFTRQPVHGAVRSSVLRAANTELAAAGHVPSDFSNTTKTCFLSASKNRFLAEGYTRREGKCTNLFHPVSEYLQHHNWPLPCTSVDELLVLLPEPSRPQGTAGRSSVLIARAQATRASTGWRALYTKRLEALLPTPWKTNVLRNLGLVQGACATAA
jgi:hypothetical protein